MESMPVVGIVADRESFDGVNKETLRTRYLEALRVTAQVAPIIIPTDMQNEELYSILSRIDGIVLGGAESNVHPERYGAVHGDMLTDIDRDTTVFSAINIAMSLELPILGICRGLQELNVALGGTLDPDLGKADDELAHLEDCTLPRDLQYEPVHLVSKENSGHIAKCMSRTSGSAAKVNSLHQQGILKLSDKLSVDALASDGLVEAVSLKDVGAFVTAVQWHPEWFHQSDRLSHEIFKSFGKACHELVRKRSGANMTQDRATF